MEIPSIVKHTARRFLVISIWVIAGGVIGYLFPIWINFCQEQFGSAFYGLIPVALVPMLWFSYSIAKLDVEREKRRNGRVLDELSRE